MRLSIRALLDAPALVVCLVLAGFVFAACGDGSGPALQNAVSVIRPPRPIWCPARRIDPQLSKPNTPKAGSFDTRILLGQPEKSAEAESRQRGCSWRVVIRDGHGLDVTADASATRVDARVDHGIVIAVGAY